MALDAIEPFFWNDLCDNYLELIKDQLFHKERYDAATVQATAWTLHHVGLRILQWYAPYMPHITETIYQDLYQKQIQEKSLHQTLFTNAQTTYAFHASETLVNKLIQLVATVRKLKTEKQLALSTELASLTIGCTDQKSADALQPLQQTIAGVARTQKITITATTQNTALEQRDGQWHATVQLTHE